jgi:CheY-like chemotaxis protein
VKAAQIPGAGPRIGDAAPAPGVPGPRDVGVEIRTSSQQSVPRQRPLVLVADDESDIAFVTKTRIRLSGYDVAVAVDGEMAVELIRNLRPDLVLLDLKMPKLNGYQVCRAVRADPDLSRTLVLVCSASSSVGLSLEKPLLLLGADGYIRKPYDVRNLLQEIARLLAQRKATGGQTLKPGAEEQTLNPKL